MYAVIFHGHQKIDKIAHKKLRKLAGDNMQFPDIKKILTFEGEHGPDASKLKNDPAVEQPWHFVNPLDASDTVLSEVIAEHYRQLVKALRGHDAIRAGFEASWVAHAIVDGLTPAHHYPYEAELSEIRGDSNRNNRTSVRKRLTVQGETFYASILKSIRLVGPKGLLTTHTAFEGGAYMLLKTLRRQRRMSGSPEVHIEDIRVNGIATFFLQQARDIAALNMYDQFLEFGWTPKLATTVNRDLLPRMIDTVALTWYGAMLDAQEATK